MYTISSLIYSPGSNQALKPALKPSRGEAVALAIEVLVAGGIIGLGLSILLLHGLGPTVVAYPCLSAPGAALLADYLIGALIKGVKNHNVLEQAKLIEDEDSDETPKEQTNISNNNTGIEVITNNDSEPVDLDKDDNKTTKNGVQVILQNDQHVQDEPKTKEKSLEEKKEDIQNQIQTLTHKKYDLIVKQQNIENSIKDQNRYKETQNWLKEKHKTQITKAQEELNLLNDPVEREKLLNRVCHFNMNTPLEIIKQKREITLKEWIETNNSTIKTMKDLIETEKQQIEFHKRECDRLKLTENEITPQIDDINKQLASLNAELTSLNT